MASATKAVTTRVTTSVTTKQHSTARLPRAQRREQIVRAAATVLLSGGYDGTSMEDVARAAGVTRLIVYRIFESKEALYLAVLTTVLDDLSARFDAGPTHSRSDVGPTHPRSDAGPTHPRSEVAAGSESVAARLLGVARRHPDGFRLLWRHASNQAEFSELYAQFASAATDYAAGLIAEVSSEPTMLRWAAESVVSHVYESICLWLDRGDVALDGQFLRMLEDGVRAMVIAWTRAG